MKKSSSTQRIHEFLALLDAEAEALMRGDIESVAELVERREYLLNAAASSQESMTPELQGLADELDAKTKRNTRLFEAALEGVTAATELVAKIKASTTNLNTYDVAGSVADIAVQQNRHERKV